MRTMIRVGVAVGLMVGMASAEEAVSGNFKWGGKGGTITGKLVPSGAEGSYNIQLEPVWKGKTKKGFDGTLTIDGSGKVSGTIDHNKEGKYTLTGTRTGNQISCQYKGKKSKKGDNPLKLTIAGK